MKSFRTPNPASITTWTATRWSLMTMEVSHPQENRSPSIWGPFCYLWNGSQFLIALLFAVPLSLGAALFSGAHWRQDHCRICLAIPIAAAVAFFAYYTLDGWILVRLCLATIIGIGGGMGL